MKGGDMMTMLAVAEGLAMSNAYNSQARARSTYVKPGKSSSEKKKRKASTRARKANKQRRKKK